MAEAVVSVTLETLRDLVLQEAKFYSNVESEVDAIQQELRRMRAFLRDADSRQDSDDRISNWVAEVREAAYDVEDSVLAYAVAKLFSKRARNSIFKRTSTFFKEIVVTYRVGSRISAIRKQIAGLKAGLQTYGIKPVLDSGTGIPAAGAGSSSSDLRRAYSHVVEEDFVGFVGLDSDMGMLVQLLTDEQRERVVSVFGMGGLGKTTIARKVYGHRDVRRHFDGFAWMCISQQWEKKDVLQAILIKLMPERREEVLAMRDEELVKQLHDVQLKKRCLVVLDDVWSGEVWERLKAAFPSVRCGSKMLVTTRKMEVVHAVSPSGYCYEPRPLTDEESWELLRKKAFPRRQGDLAEFKFDPDMVELGKEMVVRCRGLPLAIIVLGGILITKYTLRDWQMVSENINSYLAKGRGLGQQEALTKVFELSYHDLPYQFKQCFLYLANFPEDFEIEAEKLYQLWLAEGIISQDDKSDGETMMDVSERYLAELAQRCMVQVNVKETAGGFKNCRLHDLMRDLCISKAQKENFTRVIDSRRENSHSSTNKRRRISVYLDPNAARSAAVSSSDTQHIRSAFFYAGEDGGEDVLPRVNSDLRSFKLLRVLYLQGFCHRHDLPKAVGDLIHLKYLSLRSSHFKKLPSSLGSLIYLQTLDLEVEKSLELEIPNVIWKMEHLQHLYLPSNFCVEDGSKLRLDGLNELETLVNFNTSLCDVKDLHELSNLRKLRAAIKDELEDLPYIIKYISFTKNQLRRSSLSISCSKFSSDEELNLLRTLLGCHRLYKLSIRGCIAKLPEHYHFSSSIAKIAFKGSELQDDPMETLQRLEKLSSLTLYESTYLGEEIECSSYGFPRLLYLKLWGLPNLRRWRIDEGAMPKLKRLVIAECEKLEMIPDGLRFVTTLQKLNVRGMTHEFKGRLRTKNGEGVDFDKVRHVADIKLD